MQSGQGNKGYEVQTCRDLIGDIEPTLAMEPLFAAKRMNSGGDRCTRYSANCGKSKLFAMMKTLSGSSSAVERQLPKLDVAGSIPVSRSISQLSGFRLTAIWRLALLYSLSVC